MSTLDQYNHFGGGDDDDYGLENVDYDPINRDEDYEYVNDDIPEEQEEKPAFDKEKYTQNNTGIIVALVIVVVIAGLAAAYFFWWAPYQEELAAEAKAKAAQEQIEREKADSTARAEQARKEALAYEQQRIADSVAAANAEPEPGTINTITETTGRSYVVIGSFIDGDFALDFATRMAEEGHTLTVLSPPNGKGYYRVAIEGHDQYQDALSRAEEVKAEGSFGIDIWALRY